MQFTIRKYPTALAILGGYMTNNTIYNSKLPINKQVLSVQFKPTYLYIKQHNITGLKYFGKTINKNPVRYKGSGLIWTRHLKKHGNDVTTIWYQLFDEINDLIEFATRFSKENNIIDSSEWANLTFENGIAGGFGGHTIKGRKLGPMSIDHKKALSEANRGKGRPPVSDETRAKMSAARKGKPSAFAGQKHTKETKRKMSAAKRK